MASSSVVTTIDPIYNARVAADMERKTDWSQEEWDYYKYGPGEYVSKQRTDEEGNLIWYDTTRDFSADVGWNWEDVFEDGRRPDGVLITAGEGRRQIPREEEIVGRLNWNPSGTPITNAGKQDLWQHVSSYLVNNQGTGVPNEELGNMAIADWYSTRGEQYTIRPEEVALAEGIDPGEGFSAAMVEEYVKEDPTQKSQRDIEDLYGITGNEELYGSTIAAAKSQNAAAIATDSFKTDLAGFGTDFLNTQREFFLGNPVYGEGEHTWNNASGEYAGDVTGYDGKSQYSAIRDNLVSSAAINVGDRMSTAANDMSRQFDQAAGSIQRQFARQGYGGDSDAAKDALARSAFEKAKAVGGAQTAARRTANEDQFGRNTQLWSAINAMKIPNQ